MSHFESFPQKREEFPEIKSLEELSKEIKIVSDEWLNALDLDEQSQRMREAKIFQAFQTLDISEEWKTKNRDLIIDFVRVADTIPLVQELQKIFNLDSTHSYGGSFAAKQVLDEIDSMKNRDN